MIFSATADRTEQKDHHLSLPPKGYALLGSGVSLQTQAGIAQACVSPTCVSVDALLLHDFPWTPGSHGHLEMGSV